MAEIFIIKEGETLAALSQQQYESEDLLQTLLAKYPSLLAGDQVRPDAPRKWLLIKREMGVPGEEGGVGRWALDHLFLDQEGVPTLVEVKRASDTRIRREVVGQMLDYAANAVKYWPFTAMRDEFERTCAANGNNAEEILRAFRGEASNAEQFWQLVKTNLQAGRIRMLFVADEIPEELRRIVEFLNGQMDPAEVLAIEIRQFVGANVKTLVPRVLGQTAEAEGRKSTAGASGRPRRQWDETSFFAQMEAKPLPGEAQIARRVLDWAKHQVTWIWWGEGSVSASFVPVLEHNGRKHQTFAVYTGGLNGTAVVELYFQWYAGKPPFSDVAKRREMLRRLNEVPGVALPEDGIDRRPSIPLAVLAKGEALQRFLEVMDWYLDEIRGT